MDASEFYDPYSTPRFFSAPLFPTNTYDYQPRLTMDNLFISAPSVSSASTADATMAGSYSGKPNGGFGPSAYGYSGTTGLAKNRGPAKYGFQQVMLDALHRANQEMAAAGLGKFTVTDGFRSYDQQVALKAKKGDLAATPGRSVHGLGLAADLKLTPAQQKWLDANAKRLGLMRLPSEPWHFQALPSVWKSGNLPTTNTGGYQRNVLSRQVLR